VLATLEPFALDLWRREVADLLLGAPAICHLRKHSYFGGLYQKVVATRAAGSLSDPTSPSPDIVRRNSSNVDA
jgi:hypothetical protein